MEKRILKRHFLKLVFLCIATAILCTAYALASGSYGTLPVGLAIILYFFAKGKLLHKDMKNGRIVSVYAACSDKVSQKRSYTSDFKKTTEYRFVVASDDENETAFFFITAKNPNEFRIGASYCLLFKTIETGEYSEKNLVAAQQIPPNFSVFPVNPVDWEDDETKK